MHYTEITFARQKNLGSYESERLEMRAVVDEHESIDECMDRIMAKVYMGLGMDPKPQHIVEVIEGGDVVTKAGETVNPGTGKKKGKKKLTKKVKKEEVVYTLDDVRKELMKVYKARGEAIYRDIMDAFKVGKADQLEAKDYPAVMKEALKCQQ